MAIAQPKPLTEDAYLRLALADPQGQMEMVSGQPREKPGMSVEHGDLMIVLVTMLSNRLHRDEFRVRTSHARLRRAADTWYVPDVAVVPRAAERALRERPGSIDAYCEPLPLVLEIWSPSTGDFDLETKIPDYQARGDLEIWRINPHERRVTVWRRRPDGSYESTSHSGGAIRPIALPGVVIDLEMLFAD